jgi:putative FmdB family regulatory protein
MPTYEYECISCNIRYESIQPIGENVAPLCCGTAMRQVYSVPGISFKGTGWGGSK